MPSAPPHRLRADAEVAAARGDAEGSSRHARCRAVRNAQVLRARPEPRAFRCLRARASVLQPLRCEAPGAARRRTPQNGE